METAAAAPEPIDWVDLWRRLVAARVAQGAARAGTARPNADFWERRAPAFARFSAGTADDPTVEHVAALAGADGTVLDVGAGAGRHTVPLAGFVRRVVAVEPSAGMRAQLEARLAANALTNVRVVASDWATAGVEPAEVVLAANVHYAIAEIAPFLTKLDKMARRAVVLVTRVGQFRAHEELWALVHGEARVPEPGLIELYNVLFALGFVAEVRLTRLQTHWAYADVDEAVQENRDRLLIAAGSADEARLRAILTTRLTRNECGEWHWPSPPTTVATLTWTKEV